MEGGGPRGPKIWTQSYIQTTFIFTIVGVVGVVVGVVGVVVHTLVPIARVHLPPFSYHHYLHNKPRREIVHP